MNIILLLLLIISIFLVLKFSEITLPSIFPESVTKIFEQPSKDSNSFEVFRILERLSLAYISGMIIFFLINFIPRKSVEIKALKISQPALLEIYSNMGTMIAPLKMILNIEKKNKKIKLADLKQIKKYSNKIEDTYYYTSGVYINNRLSKGGEKKIFLYPKDLKELSQRVQKKVDNLTSLPSTSNLPVSLVETLSAISSSDFLRKCSTLDKVVSLPGPTEIANFDIAFYDFIKLYLKLESYEFRKLSYVYGRLGQDEIDLLREKKKNAFKEFKHTINLTSYTTIRDGIEYRVVNGKLIE